jgi:NAD(P)-dependent dehydrogenase (short-subunit alcohol dehydrogenase family)
LTEADDAAVQQLVNTNFKGVFSGMRHAARRMVTGGVIVNMASFNGTKMPVPIAVPYGATKAAVVSMTQSAALGLQDRGVSVFALCPYIVDTPMLDRLTGGQGPEVRAAFAAQFAPSKRLTTPDEIAQVVLGLCRRNSGYRSGDVLVVDAGPSVTPF